MAVAMAGYIRVEQHPEGEDAIELEWKARAGKAVGRQCPDEYRQRGRRQRDNDRVREVMPEILLLEEDAVAIERPRCRDDDGRIGQVVDLALE